MSRSVGTAPRPASRGVASSAGRFRERAIARRRRPWRRLVALLLVAVVVGVPAWALGWSDLLAVRDVQVVGVTGPEETEVRALVEIPDGTPLVRVDTAAVEARIRTRVTVAEVSVSRAWPRTLKVEVVPRTPAIVVKDPRGRLEVVDAGGVAFGSISRAPAGVPVVTATGEKGMTQDALRAALALLDALPRDLARKVSAVTVSSANLVSFTLSGRTVVWGGAEEPARKIAILRALMRTPAKVVDVSAPDTPVTR